jgi:anaphase-promoting complex subunit 2
VHGRVRCASFRRYSQTKHSSYHILAGTPIGRLVLRLADWYFAWAPGGECVCPCFLRPAPLPSYDTSPSRLGHTISSAYIVTFQTHVFSVLPATFAAGFKRLLAATLALSTEGVTPDIPASVQDSRLWPSFELLGLADRYESLITSVCYEHIEKHVVETCAGKWDEPMLSRLREWMAEKVVPWMLLPYARGAKTGKWLSLLNLSCA